MGKQALADHTPLNTTWFLIYLHIDQVEHDNMVVAQQLMAQKNYAELIQGPKLDKGKVSKHQVYAFMPKI